MMPSLSSSSPPTSAPAAPAASFSPPAHTGVAPLGVALLAGGVASGLAWATAPTTLVHTLPNSLPNQTRHVYQVHRQQGLVRCLTKTHQTTGQAGPSWQRKQQARFGPQGQLVHYQEWQTQGQGWGLHTPTQQLQPTVFKPHPQAEAVPGYVLTRTDAQHSVWYALSPQGDVLELKTRSANPKAVAYWPPVAVGQQVNLEELTVALPHPSEPLSQAPHATLGRALRWGLGWGLAAGLAAATLQGLLVQGWVQGHHPPKTEGLPPAPASPAPRKTPP